MKHFAIAFIMLFCANLKAQNQYEQGYFIDNQGTVTTCLIKNLDWRQNPTDFTYKLDLNNETELKATISNVKEFAIGTLSKYKRFNIKIERSSSDINRLNKTREPIWSQEVLFLKVLVEGDANLYAYNDSSIQKFFYDSAKNSISQLIQIKYLENNVTHYYNFYKQQLSNDINCKKQEDYFKNLKYNTSALTEHFLSYNKCMGGTVTKYERKSQKAFSLKATGSVNYATLKMEDPKKLYNVNSKVSKIIPKIGIELEFTLPFNHNRWSLFFNPTYNQFNIESDFTNPDGLGGNRSIDHTVTVKYNSIEFPLGIRHYFPINNDSKIFANAAIAFDLPFNSSINFTNRQQFVNAEETRKVISGYYISIGGGYKYKKMAAELRYTAPRNITGVEDARSNSDFRNIGLLFSYEIF